MLPPVDQNLEILEAAWRKDQAGPKLSDWHEQLPAMRPAATRRVER